MARIFNFGQTQLPLWQRSLYLTCLILFIPFTTVVLIVLALIPLYLPNHTINHARSSIGSSLTVAYLVMDSNTRSFNGIDMKQIDRQRMAQSFERSIGLRMKHVLQIGSIKSDVTQGNRTSIRKKRFVKCDRDPEGLDGPVLIFNFNLTHPIQRVCQTTACANQTFVEIYQQFQSVPNVSIDFTNVTRQLRLCSLDVISYEEYVISEDPIETSSTISTTNSPFNASVTRTTIPTTTISGTGTSSSSGPISTVSTTIPSNSTNQSSTTDSIIISSPISSTTSHSSSLTTITTTAVISTTSDITSAVPINDTQLALNECLRKIPFTQESVSPYRITHTSTIFARDDPTLIIVGAAKIESLVSLQSIQQQIMINGVNVYRDCQRTIEISIPTMLLFRL